MREKISNIRKAAEMLVDESGKTDKGDMEID
jgi:hypothetical protein